MRANPESLRLYICAECAFKFHETFAESLELLDVKTRPIATCGAAKIDVHFFFWKETFWIVIDQFCGKIPDYSYVLSKEAIEQLS